MTGDERIRSYKTRLEALMKTLYEFDPDGIGQSIDAPPDEYRDLATMLVSRLWAAGDESQAAGEIRSLFPTAEQALIDALWAVRQEIE
jgi:hypothetical protein